MNIASYNLMRLVFSKWMRYLNYYFKKAFPKLYDLRNESSSSAMIFLFVHFISIVFWRAKSNFFFRILMHSNLCKLKFCAITLYVVAKKNEITIKVCSVSFSVQNFFFSFFFVFFLQILHFTGRSHEILRPDTDALHFIVSLRLFQ